MAGDERAYEQAGSELERPEVAGREEEAGQETPWDVLLSGMLHRPLQQHIN